VGYQPAYQARAGAGVGKSLLNILGVGGGEGNSLLTRPGGGAVTACLPGQQRGVGRGAGNSLHFRPEVVGGEGGSLPTRPVGGGGVSNSRVTRPEGRGVGRVTGCLPGQREGDGRANRLLTIPERGGWACKQAAYHSRERGMGL
jgi:hypothetical protein